MTRSGKGDSVNDKHLRRQFEQAGLRRVKAVPDESFTDEFAIKRTIRREVNRFDSKS